MAKSGSAVVLALVTAVAVVVGNAGPVVGSVTDPGSGDEYGVAGPVPPIEVSSDDQKAFIERVGPQAQRGMVEYGVPATVSVAQAALESAWGKSAPGNNHFGIKCAAQDDPGPVATGCQLLDTVECQPQCQPAKAWFRVYATIEDSFRDHGAFLRGMPRYAECFNHTDNPGQFARELQKAGYATDPQYADKLINLMVTHDLFRFDNVTPPTLTGVMSDVTGDGRPDIIARGSDGTLWVHPHDGKTGPGAAFLASYAVGPGWNGADVLMAGDVTGDGRPDIIAREPAGDLWIHPHDGKTGAGAAFLPRYAAGPGWNVVNAMVVADVTADGRPDIVARDADGNVWVYPHDGKTGAGAAFLPRYAAAAGWNVASALTAADVTCDGKPDVIARDTSGTMRVYPHDGRTGAGAAFQNRYAVGPGWHLASALLTGDVTGDGKTDVVARDTNGNLWVYPHDGKTGVGAAFQAPYPAGPGWNFATALT